MTSSISIDPQPSPRTVFAQRASQAFSSRYRREVAGVEGGGVWQWSKLASDMAEETWEIEDARAEGPWSDVMHVLYEVERFNALEEHDSVRPCVLRGKLFDGEPDSAHIVAPDNNKSGAKQIDYLAQQNVVPPHARHYLPSNRLPLASALHTAFNQHSLTLQPSFEAVLARLVSEYQYQAARQTSLKESAETSQTKALRERSAKRTRRSEPASQLPVRPPFDLFYDRLERDLAILLPTFTPEFALPEYPYYSPHDEAPSATRVRPVLNRFKPPPDATAVAPFLAPVSTNLVIYAMRRRIRQYEPAPLDQQPASQVLANAVGLLDRFWHLSDAHADEVHLLLEETLAFVATLPSSLPYVPFFRSPASANFDYSLVPLPAIPAGSRTTLGTTPGNRAALDWLSSGSESEPGLTPSEVSGLSCSSDDSDSERPRAAARSARRRAAGWSRYLSETHNVNRETARVPRNYPPVPVPPEQHQLPPHMRDAFLARQREAGLGQGRGD